jgi:hypothetical protein
MAREIITSGSAPVVWSTISEAFEKINSNFSELYATVGGGEPFDFTQITTSMIPATNTEYDLGSGSKRWKTVYVSRYGISVGGALINSEDGLTLNLPAGTTVDGELIRNPEESSFKTFAVSGQDNVVANNFSGTVTLATGNGISISTDADSDTITFTNNGVTEAVAGTGLSVSSPSGSVTFTNTGVTSLSAGSGITVSAATGGITVDNSGVLSVVTDAGSGIGLDTSVPGVVRISNTLPSTLINAFRLIAVSGEVNVTAQNSADTLTLIKGTGIDIETTLSKEITFTNTGVTQLAASGPGLSVSAATGNITVSFDNRIDIVGSVFADDSSVIVDAVNNELNANSVNAIGMYASVISSRNLGPLLQITAGQVGGTSQSIYINPQGSDTLIRSIAETHTWLTGAFGDAGPNPSVQFKTAGAFKALDGAYFEGNLTGSVDGDITGSVFGDDSTKLVDGAESKIVGPVESPSVYGTTYIQTAVYADSGAISTAIPAATKGMIVFNDDTGKFQGWDGSAWQDLNDRSGDSLRAAFTKINANFTELYAALGIDADAIPNIGAFEFNGSTISTTDSTAITIDQATTVSSDLTVGGDIIPQTANGGDLGSATKPWRSLYVSNNTIFIGGTAVSINRENLQLMAVQYPEVVIILSIKISTQTTAPTL